MVQRTLEKYRKRDKMLDNCLSALWALDIDNVPEGDGGYYDRWKDLAMLFLAHEEGKSPFLYASYG